MKKKKRSIRRNFGKPIPYTKEELLTEVWKIVEKNNKYEVSNIGRIRYTDTKKLVDDNGVISYVFGNDSLAKYLGTHDNRNMLNHYIKKHTLEQLVSISNHPHIKLRRLDH